jgi:hypothetical protein
MIEVMPSDKAMKKDVVEIVDNPFDVSKNQFLGVDSRKARRKKRQKPRSSNFSTTTHHFHII